MEISKFEILKQTAASVHSKTTIAFILIIAFLCYFVMWQENKISALKTEMDEAKVRQDSALLDQKIGVLKEHNKKLDQNIAGIETAIKELKKKEVALQKQKELTDKQIEDYWSNP